MTKSFVIVETEKRGLSKCDLIRRTKEEAKKEKEWYQIYSFKSKALTEVVKVESETRFTFFFRFFRFHFLPHSTFAWSEKLPLKINSQCFNIIVIISHRRRDNCRTICFLAKTFHMVKCEEINDEIVIKKKQIGIASQVLKLIFLWQITTVCYLESQCHLMLERREYKYYSKFQCPRVF